VAFAVTYEENVVTIPIRYGETVSNICNTYGETVVTVAVRYGETVSNICSNVWGKCGDSFSKVWGNR